MSSKPAYTIPTGTGAVIGMAFHEGRWYRYSSTLNAWALCDEQQAVEAVNTIVSALNAVPFDPALSAALNIGGGDATKH